MEQNGYGVSGCLRCELGFIHRGLWQACHSIGLGGRWKYPLDSAETQARYGWIASIRPVDVLAGLLPVSGHLCQPDKPLLAMRSVDKHCWLIVKMDGNMRTAPDQYQYRWTAAALYIALTGRNGAKPLVSRTWCFANDLDH